MKRPILAVLLFIACAAAAALAANAVVIRDAWLATADVPGFERVKMLPAAMRGRIEAERDIRRGDLCLKTWGLRPPSPSPYEKLLRDRLGVETRVVAGCVVSDQQLASWAGYNQAMLSEISRRHGADAVDRVYQEAQAREAADICRRPLSP